MRVACCVLRVLQPIGVRTVLGQAEECGAGAVRPCVLLPRVRQEVDQLPAVQEGDHRQTRHLPVDHRVR